MNVGKTFYATNRREWRGWLSKHHRTAPEIWLIYYKKQSGKPRIPYNHAVDEALCYGWIDSLLKPIDADRYAQRFSPRRPTSRLSAMNRERVRRLIAAGRMTGAGLESIKHAFDHRRDAKPRPKWEIPRTFCGASRATGPSGGTSSAFPHRTNGSASAGSWPRGAGGMYSSSGSATSSR